MDCARPAPGRSIERVDAKSRLTECLFAAMRTLAFQYFQDVIDPEPQQYHIAQEQQGQLQGTAHRNLLKHRPKNDVATDYE